MEFQLDREDAAGICRYCKDSNLFTKTTCDNCGLRLPWADGIADELGEKCPRCDQFNTYIRSVCVKCDEKLPWYECVAALYHRNHDAEKEQKALGWTVLIVAVVVVGILYFVFGMLQMSRQFV